MAGMRTSFGVSSSLSSPNQSCFPHVTIIAASNNGKSASHVPFAWVVDVHKISSGKCVRDPEVLSDMTG